MKRIPVTIHIDTYVEVGDDYSDESLLFLYNDGTHCINNDLDRLAESLDSPPWQCQCGNSYTTLGHSVEDMRRATEEPTSASTFASMETGMAEVMTTQEGAIRERMSAQARIAKALEAAIDASIAGEPLPVVDDLAVSSKKPRAGEPIPARVQRAATTAPGACAAVTRKSQRCKVPADPDSEFCHLHRPDGKYQQNLKEAWDRGGPPVKRAKNLPI